MTTKPTEVERSTRLSRAMRAYVSGAFLGASCAPIAFAQNGAAPAGQPPGPPAAPPPPQGSYPPPPQGSYPSPYVPSQQPVYPPPQYPSQPVYPPPQFPYAAQTQGQGGLYAPLAPQADGVSGLELGVRLGYSIPFGNVTGAQNASLSNVVSGQLPLGVDVGYRINPSFYLGGFFQYGVLFAANNTTTGCGQNGVNCSGNDVQLGVEAAYHPSLPGSLDPWLGVGAGYEIAKLNITQGTTSASVSLNGFQFLYLMAGADYKVEPNLGIGPFVSFSLGQYSNGQVCQAGGQCVSNSVSNSAMHEWLTFGLRGAYDVKL